MKRLLEHKWTKPFAAALLIAAALAAAYLLQPGQSNPAAADITTAEAATQAEQAPAALSERYIDGVTAQASLPGGESRPSSSMLSDTTITAASAQGTASAQAARTTAAARVTSGHAPQASAPAAKPETTKPATTKYVYTAAATTARPASSAATTTTTQTTATTTTAPAKKTLTAALTIRCDTVLNNMDKLRANRNPPIPPNGIIVSAKTVTFTEGESVFAVLQREARSTGIHMETMNNPLYNSAYIKGINNLYEFDFGELSGWMYKVNGWFPNYGCSQYTLKQGDVIEWVYTCDLGNDVGGGYAAGTQGG